jgi:hypothetical protein
MRPDLLRAIVFRIYLPAQMILGGSDFGGKRFSGRQGFTDYSFLFVLRLLCTFETLSIQILSPQTSLSAARSSVGGGRHAWCFLKEMLSRRKNTDSHTENVVSLFLHFSLACENRWSVGGGRFVRPT